MRLRQPYLRTVTILLAGMVMTYLAASQAFVTVFNKRAPQLVERLAPNDPTVTGLRFDEMLLKDPAAKVDAEWQAKARRILRETPLSPGAIRIIALANADATQRRSLMGLAERVSKRDLLTQLWLIEDAVQRDHLGDALAHYDRALSVFPASRNMLFPILAAALNLSDIRRTLAPYIRANRPWAYDFVGYAIDHATSPAHVADLLQRSGGSRAVPGQRPVETAMLARLIVKGEIPIADRYARMMAGANSAILDRFPIGEQTLDPSLRPFTWSLVDDLRLDVNFDPEQGLVIVVPPNVHGLVANRIMVLPAGRWVLTQTVELPSLSPMASGTWKATCVGRGVSRPILTQGISLRSGRSTYRAGFEVPKTCAAVKFELTAQGSDAQIEARMVVIKMSLSRE